MPSFTAGPKIATVERIEWHTIPDAATAAAALQEDEPKLHGAFAPDLPQGENVALFLTLQKEPLGQCIYLAGVHAAVREDLRPQLFSAKRFKVPFDHLSRISRVAQLANAHPAFLAATPENQPDAE